MICLYVWNFPCCLNSLVSKTSLLLKIKRGTFGKHAFRRWIFEEIKVQWVELWKDLMKFQLIEEKDVIWWNLEKNRKFSVKSLCNAMSTNDSSSAYTFIWRSKNLAKIKIFLWLMEKNAILIKVNLLSRISIGNPSYFFYYDNKIHNTCISSALLQKLFGQ